MLSDKALVSGRMPKETRTQANGDKAKPKDMVSTAGLIMTDTKVNG